MYIATSYLLYHAKYTKKPNNKILKRNSLVA